MYNIYKNKMKVKTHVHQYIVKLTTTQEIQLCL